MKQVQSLTLVKKIAAAVALSLVLLLFLTVALRIAYFGRIYPGVTANGVYLGGLTADEAVELLNKESSAYATKKIDVVTPKGTVQTSASEMGVVYNNSQAVSDAVGTARSGWYGQRIVEQIESLLGFAKPITQITYSSVPLSNQAGSLSEKVSSSVSNAGFVVQNNELSLTPSQRGVRLSYSALPGSLAEHFGNLNTKLYVPPTFYVEPTIDSGQLASQKNIIMPFEKQPLTLSYGGKNWVADPTTIISWLSVASQNQPLTKDIYTNFYTKSTKPNSSLSFDKKAISDWLSSIAGEINVTPVDAELTISGDRATVFRQSRDGKTLDIETSASTVLQSLTSGSVQPVPLAVATTKAEVSNDNIESLGIKELISEGVSYFPGSSANRMQNVRTGASKFNGVLIRPGENFSFNKYLGEVSAATGYAEGIVILADREEIQYGGGLCQVSSTAYRAALMAGLPITSRVNHAFAVDYYTQPFGVPGVDATIYLPNPDMQFRNDTGKYILMQTEMIGTTLKFRFYGTKVKTGRIRGPFFVTGSLDHTQPSQTVFYRDVLDMAGNVIKTDTTTTYYKSSLDYPLVN